MTTLNFLLVFILAHLTGDFAFQTDKIAKAKSEGYKGLFVHVGIVTVLQVAIMSIFGWRGMAAALISGLVHLFIDFCKQKLAGHLKHLQFAYFIFDQAVHFLVIIALSYILAAPTDIAAGLFPYIKAVICLITLIFAATVASKILLRDISYGISKEPFFRKGERSFDAVSVLALWAVWLLPAVWSLAAAAVLFPAYLWLQKTRFKYKPWASSLKYLIYVLLGYFAMYFQKFMFVI